MTRKKKKSKYETNTTALPPHINLYRNIAEDLASSRFYIVEEAEACNHIAPMSLVHDFSQVITKYVNVIKDFYALTVYPSCIAYSTSLFSSWSSICPSLLASAW